MLLGRELLAATALAALLLGLAATQPSDFPNPGGPPDIIGLWASPGEDGVGVSSCLVNGSEFSCSHLSEGLPIVQLGSFSSYECAGPGEDAPLLQANTPTHCSAANRRSAGAAGEYVGYLQRVVFDAQGNLLENETRCERGRVDQDTGSWSWWVAAARVYTRCWTSIFACHLQLQCKCCRASTASKLRVLLPLFRASFVAPDCPASSDLEPGLVMVDSVL